jgi:putative mRNA 3-end processing factor
VTDLPIDVAGSGAVTLGDEVVCDGFQIGYPVRAQTHVHMDHMMEFERSKGFQDIYMTRPTRRLLEAERNADLPYRSNLVDTDSGVTHQLEKSTLTLVKSDHMLGSAQVLVELSSGVRLGYSGDFQWPMETPIQADALVVDSTYGSPNSQRLYSQGEAEDQFLELVLSRLAYGPVHVKAHRGTVQRALQVLDGQVDCAVLGSNRFIAEVAVYREFGYAICDVLGETAEAADQVRADGRYIQFYGKGDRLPVDVGVGTMISLSAYMSRPDTPLLVYSERAFRVAMSNHADFRGTLEYVAATGAKYVVTDNTRGRGVELAVELRARLGVDARPSQNELSLEWGS